MTEVKNNSLDLMNMQFASSLKKQTGSNPADALSGFKTMLKDKNQRPNNENSKTSDKKKDDLEPAVENAVAAMAKPESQVRDTALEEPEAGQELIAEPVQSDKGVQLLAGLWEEGQTESQFQTLDQLRFQQLLGAQKNIQDQVGTQALETVSNHLQTGDAVEIQAVSLSGENLHMEEVLKPEDAVQPEVMKEQPKEPLTAMPVTEEKVVNNQEGLKEAQSVEVQTPVKTMDTNEESAEQIQEMSAFEVHKEQKDALSGKEEQLTEESAAALQERPYQEPVHRLNTGKEQAGYTTVKVENSEDLEAKLSEQLLKQIQSGRKELEVQLEPVNLGKIHIKVSYENNQVSVSVLCTESKTLKALSLTAGDLGSILESNLERPVQILVDKQENDYLNNQQQQEGRQQQQQQEQQPRQDGKDSSDFLQKMRLGILDADGADASYSDYR